MVSAGQTVLAPAKRSSPGGHAANACREIERGPRRFGEGPPRMLQGG